MCTTCWFLPSITPLTRSRLTTALLETPTCEYMPANTAAAECWLRATLDVGLPVHPGEPALHADWCDPEASPCWPLPCSQSRNSCRPGLQQFHTNGRPAITACSHCHQPKAAAGWTPQVQCRQPGACRQTDCINCFEPACHTLLGACWCRCGRASPHLAHGPWEQHGEPCAGCGPPVRRAPASCAAGSRAVEGGWVSKPWELVCSPSAGVEHCRAYLSSSRQLSC